MIRRHLDEKFDIVQNILGVNGVVTISEGEKQIARAELASLQNLRYRIDARLNVARNGGEVLQCDVSTCDPAIELAEGISIRLTPESRRLYPIVEVGLVLPKNCYARFEG